MPMTISFELTDDDVKAIVIPAIANSGHPDPERLLKELMASQEFAKCIGNDAMSQLLSGLSRPHSGAADYYWEFISEFWMRDAPNFEG